MRTQEKGFFSFFFLRGSWVVISWLHCIGPILARLGTADYILLRIPAVGAGRFLGQEARKRNLRTVFTLSHSRASSAMHEAAWLLGYVRTNDVICMCAITYFVHAPSHGISISAEALHPYIPGKHASSYSVPT